MTLPLFNNNGFVSTATAGELLINTPDLITKDLKLSVLPSGHKRIRLSSNFLPLIGFTAGTRIQVDDAGVNEGLKITFNPNGASKVYLRKYTQRKNNPLETQIDIQHQSLIERAIPADTERLHFSLRNGSILIKALYSNTFAIRKAIQRSLNPLNTFVAMTGGIDAHCLRATGFTIDSILEYRPQEARDKRDFTETGALSCLANVPVRNLFNEDISKIDWENVKRESQKGGPTGLLHLSLQCDDFSNGKAKKLKEKSVDNIDTSADLVYDGLRMIETVSPACAVIENVPGFGTSAMGELMRVKLRKWGYHVTDAVLDAREHGGLTSRQRYYLVASIWPGFEMPSVSVEPRSVWPVVLRHLDKCRDITETSTVHLGIQVGRSRLITKDSRFAPTVMKSQNRQAKDSIYIEHEGRYFMPTEDLLRDLNGFPSDLKLNAVSETIASELIGQSIEYPMHHKLMGQIRDHILLNVR